MTVGQADPVERPRAVPAEGVIEAFDAGWNAHRIGLERDSVETFAHPSGQGWALLGWNARQQVAPDWIAW